MSHEYHPTSTTRRILCCECGVAMEPNAANMCLSCIRSKVDITAELPKQITVSFCRGCDRYLQPPAQWLPCTLESKELLALLLRRIKGLSKVRLVDAGFVWTEPHSRRIKVKLTVQGEAFTATILQQTVVIETIVANQQCPDCARREAKNTWNTVVQVRQKTEHKRTFLFLEQLIIKHSAHRDTVGIRAVREGIDFYFDSRSSASKFVSFLQAVVPIRSKISEQLITQDVHSGDSTYKFAMSVEIVPICRDDLVFLPPKLSKAMGGLGPLVLCTRVGTSLHFIDPLTLQTTDISSCVYWRDPFYSLASSRALVEFYILDVDYGGGNVAGRTTERVRRADVLVTRASEFGMSGSRTITAITHLGHLKPGDLVLGYDVQTSNYNNEYLDNYTSSRHRELPDVVLVRKSYKHLRNNRRRPWKLKQLDMEVEETTTTPAPSNHQDDGQEYERFLQDLEEDPEMRANINIYRDSHQMDQETVSELEDPDVPRISLEELLEDLTLQEENGEDTITT